MDDIALALCGGGGKGAFHIGVWKALEEHGILKNVKAVSGTSVGALNAVLFALKDFDNAKRIWYSIDNSVLLAPNNPAEMLQKGGLFSRDGLEKILKDVPLEKLRTSDIKVFVTLHDVKARKPIHIPINDLCQDEIITVLLATSAIPAAYGPVEYNGIEYVDGGYTEFGNVPIEPLYKNGFRNIYILSLNRGFNLRAIKKLPISFEIIDAYNYYPGCVFTPIQPSEDIGATLDFSQSGIRARMIKGYVAAEEVLSDREVIL